MDCGLNDLVRQIRVLNGERLALEDRLRSFLPEAVLAPAFTPGWKTCDNDWLSGPLTGLPILALCSDQQHEQ